MSRDWWPLSNADPVPGDPETLAALGGHLADAAAEIEAMASTLPKICASGTWDSDAGEQFRVRAASTAASIGRTHRRFFTVARALGSSIYGGGGGYAAQLQEHQEKADAALAAVNGTSNGMGTAGSETERRRAWTQLLDATHGADPTRPLPRSATTGATGSSGVPTLTGVAGIAGVAVPGVPVTPAGPMPLASPGVIPPHLPAFPDDPADVTALKNSTAIKTWQDGKFGDALGKDAVGTLWRGFKSAAGMSSPEIGSAMSKAVEAGDNMPYAKGVTWVVTSRIEGYQELFRVTQGAGLATDGIGKLDSTLNYFDKHLPGYDGLKSALPHGSGG